MKSAALITGSRSLSLPPRISRFAPSWPRTTISLGHLVGRHGLVFGVNIIDPPSSGTDYPEGVQPEDRLIRPYIAGLFKF